MSKYYTNLFCYGNSIMYRGIDNGRRVKKKISYSPVLFLPTNKNTEWSGLHGEKLEPKKFETIRDARDFIKKYDEVQNFKVYGNSSFEYAFIADTQRGMIDWSIDDINIAIIDIEVGSENGFPNPDEASEPITAIAIRRLNGDTKVYGCGEYNNTHENVEYIHCRDEYTLCRNFITDWEVNCPDVITGWNTKFFDIPYLYNRFNRILGEEMTKKLSPWGILSARTKVLRGRQQTFYDISGIASLDYIELYKWYAPGGKSQESYRLDNIANVELGESKISYDEFDNLHQLYKLNYQKFIDYNIKDVELIVKLESKLKLLELALTLAYDTKCNYEDVFAQTRMWDSLIYSYLFEKKIVVPPKMIKEKTEAFEGAYVKEPQVGKHDWVASFDLNSLYPHLLIQYNISPETIVEPQDYTPEMREVIAQGVTVEKLLDRKVNLSRISNVTITPNGQFFRTDKRGFIPTMMEEMYEDRKKFKKLMIKSQQDYQVETDSTKKKELENLIARYNNLQLAKKVSLNSAYGAMGSQYFRFYDLRMALGVTSAGQLSIRWIDKAVNKFMNKMLGTDNVDYVIASDTDSIYVEMDELVKRTGITDEAKIVKALDEFCETKIQKLLDSSYQELADYMKAYQQKMFMKRETIANKGIWKAKKMYILNAWNVEGVQYDEPKLKIQGIEAVRSSTPHVCREYIKNALAIIMNENEKALQKYISDAREEYKSLPFEDIAFPRGANNLDQYYDEKEIYRKSTPIHVKGSLIFNRLIKDKGLRNIPPISNGDKIKFCYLKLPNTLKDTVIANLDLLPKELDIDQYIDYDKQFDKSFLDPIKSITTIIGWEPERKLTLEGLFE